jgi:uncharacterized protein YecA (UPF0149 family)
VYRGVDYIFNPYVLLKNLKYDKFVWQPHSRLGMARELDPKEIAIQRKAQQLLEALQALADLSNELNIPKLVIELEVLSLQLEGDSNLMSPTHGIAKLYDELISAIGLVHTKLTEINLAAQVEP